MTIALHKGMTTEHRENHVHSKSAGSIPPNGGSAKEHPAHSRGERFARRARTLFSGLPTSFQEQVTQHPYRALGLALAIGVGAGVVLGNRILRAAVASAVSAAIVELGREYLLHGVDETSSLRPARSAHTNAS